MNGEPLRELVDFSRQRRADNELLFKADNERVSEVTQRVFDPQDNQEVPISFVCECANRDCVEHVSLVHQKYEAVRQDPNAFIIVPGHSYAEIEQVVEEQPTYQVVVKKEKYRPKS